MVAIYIFKNWEKLQMLRLSSFSTDIWGYIKDSYCFHLMHGTKINLHYFAAQNKNDKIWLEIIDLAMLYTSKEIKFLIISTDIKLILTSLLIMFPYLRHRRYQPSQTLLPVFDTLLGAFVSLHSSWFIKFWLINIRSERVN